MRDSVGWSKTVIRNYLIDRWRRSKTEGRRSPAFALPESDIADDITDQIIARKALAFVESLDDQSHMIVMMAWADGLNRGGSLALISAYGDGGRTTDEAHLAWHM